jgi:hypothetical protein
MQLPRAAPSIMQSARTDSYPVWSGALPLIGTKYFYFLLTYAIKNCIFYTQFAGVLFFENVIINGLYKVQFLFTLHRRKVIGVSKHEDKP